MTIDRSPLPWTVCDATDPAARLLADRHYSRQKPGSARFVPPGRCLVLKAIDAAGVCRAVWATSWPFAEYTRHDWAGAWICSIFRNEGAGLSSALIRQAVAHTLWKYPRPPALGMITFVRRESVKARKGRRAWGWCYQKAGFEPCGYTKGGLVALQLKPDQMPEPVVPIGGTLPLLCPVSPDPAELAR